MTAASDLALEDWAREPDPHIPPFLERHRGLFTPKQVERLMGAKVAIAGVGGVGGRVAEVLARSGIGELQLADPDVFTESNLNRQAASTLDTLGHNKAEVVTDACRSVSPIVQVASWSQGITAENVDAFICGADVVVDGTDYTHPSLGLMLARSAAGRGIPVVLGVEVAFGAWHTVLRELGDFERLFRLPRSVTFADLDDGHTEIPLWRWIASVPPYVDLDSLRQLTAGEIEAPAIAPAVELSAALLATDVISLLLGQRASIRAPRIQAVDLRRGTARTFRPTRARFTASLLRVVARDRRTWGSWK